MMQANDVVKAFSVYGAVVGKNGNGFARRYVVVRTADDTVGMVEALGMSGERELTELAVQMLSGELNKVAEVSVEV